MGFWLLPGGCSRPFYLEVGDGALRARFRALRESQERTNYLSDKLVSPFLPLD